MRWKGRHQQLAKQRLANVFDINEEEGEVVGAAPYPKLGKGRRSAALNLPSPYHRLVLMA